VQWRQVPGKYFLLTDQTYIRRVQPGVSQCRYAARPLSEECMGTSLTSGLFA
jgi:hypothetical protein